MPIPTTLPPIPPVAHGLADELRRRAGSTTGARRLGWMNCMIAVYNDDTRQAHRLLQALAVLGDAGAIRGLIEDNEQNGHSTFEPGDRVTTPDGHGTVTDTDNAEKAFFGVPQDAITVLIDGDDEGEDRYYLPGDVTHVEVAR